MIFGCEFQWINIVPLLIRAVDACTQEHELAGAESVRESIADFAF